VVWAQEWPERIWAVEGASGLGHGVAQAHTAAGERVVDVLAKLAARARLLGSGSARKTASLTDAVSVASVAIHNSKLSVVSPEDHSAVLRLLSDRRDDIASARTRRKNRLHVLLRGLVPSGARTELSAPAAAVFLAKVRPTTATDYQRKLIACQLLDDIRRAHSHLITIARTIETAVAESRSTLPEVQGIGIILAAKIIDHAGDVARFESTAHFASYTGTAPVEASSGDIRRHRLNRVGNRQLNTALHTAALVQARDGKPELCSTTTGTSPRTRPPTKLSAASNGSHRTSCSATSSTIETDNSPPPLDTEALSGLAGRFERPWGRNTYNGREGSQRWSEPLRTCRVYLCSAGDMS
jgi:transposase